MNKLYKYSVKYNNQQQYKAILESSVVSILEIFTDNIPMSPGPYVTVKNPSAKKSLRLFTELFDVKNKSAVRQVGGSKSKRKSIRSGSMGLLALGLSMRFIITICALFSTTNNERYDFGKNSCTDNSARATVWQILILTSVVLNFKASLL